MELLFFYFPEFRYEADASRLDENKTINDYVILNNEYLKQYN